MRDPEAQSLLVLLRGEGVRDPEEAREVLAELLARGGNILISAPAIAAEKVREEGFRANPDWSGHPCIVGTLFPALGAYEGTAGENRIVWRLNLTRLAQYLGRNPVAPRFTGNPPAFHGVVFVECEHVPPSFLEELGPAAAVNALLPPLQPAKSKG